MQPTANTMVGKSVNTIRQKQDRRCKGERRQTLRNKQSVAKMGMAVSMGTLITTGFMGGRGAKTLHIWSGLALIGFSVWHHRLYQPGSQDNRR